MENKNEILKEDLERCDLCNELSETLFDTEGLINGGIGLVCESCYIDCIEE